MAMKVEQARPGDAEAIASVHVKSWQSAYRGQFPDSFLDSMSPSQWVPMWTRLLADPQHVILTLRSGLEIVGFCDFGRSRDDGATAQTAELYTIYLAPSHWGCGNGSLLFEATLASLNEQGYSDITCWVLQTNLRAIAFYQRHHFQFDGGLKTEMWGKVELREVRMKRSIHPP